LVAQMHERLGREHGILLSLTDLFQFPSVRSLAQHLAETRPLAGTPIASMKDTRAAEQRQALSRFRKPPMASR
jgi:hypothetical protein